MQYITTFCYYIISLHFVIPLRSEMHCIAKTSWSPHSTDTYFHPFAFVFVTFMTNTKVTNEKNTVHNISPCISFHSTASYFNSKFTKSRHFTTFFILAQQPLTYGCASQNHHILGTKQNFFWLWDSDILIKSRPTNTLCWKTLWFSFLTLCYLWGHMRRWCFLSPDYSNPHPLQFPHQSS